MCTYCTVYTQSWQRWPKHFYSTTTDFSVSNLSRLKSLSYLNKIIKYKRTILEKNIYNFIKVF